MNSNIHSNKRRVMAFFIIAGLFLFNTSCAAQPVAGISPSPSIQTFTPTPSPESTPTPTVKPTASPVPTPTSTPEPTPSPTPQPVDGLDNSTGAFPHIARTGSTLFYINRKDDPRAGFTLYRMGLDGSKRKFMLTDAQCLKLFKKSKKNAVAVGMMNILYIKDKRIFFLCMTVESISKVNKNTVYILSIDYAMKNLKIEKQLKKPDDQQKFWDWFIANSGETMTKNIALRGFRLPIVQDDWMYYTNDERHPNQTNQERHLYKSQLDGSEEKLLFGSPVDRFIVQGEWVYFEKRDTTGIYRISVNGGTESKIGDVNNTDHIFPGFVVLGDWIYYNEQDEKTKVYSMHKLKIDGSENVMIPTKFSPYSFQIINNQIFYNTIGNANAKGSWNLRVMNLDGTGDRAID